MARITRRLADLASGRLLDQALVIGKTPLSDRFVRVELRSERFRSASWTPGAKIQMRPERGTLAMRTYTPTVWDTAEGTTALIAFTHGDGPASAWFERAATGDVCELFGPRRSLDLSGTAAKVVFVGDESSVGLAGALHTTKTEGVTHILEADAPAELTTVLTALGITQNVTVVSKTPGREELLSAARDAAGADEAPYDLVVTGDAATVHLTRRAAREWHPRPARVLGKAYWAEGRTGLD